MCPVQCYHGVCKIVFTSVIALHRESLMFECIRVFLKRSSVALVYFCFAALCDVGQPKVYHDLATLDTYTQNKKNANTDEKLDFARARIL